MRRFMVRGLLIGAVALGIPAPARAAGTTGTTAAAGVPGVPGANGPATGPGEAGAAATPAPSDEAITRDAQARFDEGLARLKASKFDEARLSFTQAYALQRRPSILWNLALAEEKSGHVLDALAHFRDYAREATADEEHARAQKHVDALMAQTGHIDVEAFGGTPLTVDGAPAGQTPLAEPLDVLPGRHHVEARAPLGAKSADVEVAAGQVAHVNFMAVDVPPSAAGDGSPAVAIAPSPAAPGGPPPAPAGESAAGARFWTPKVITVTALGGAAVVAGGLGVYFALQSQSKASTADGYRATNPPGACATAPPASICQDWNDAVDAQNHFATASNVLYVSGAVLAAGAVATWFLWPKGNASPAAGSAQLMPLAGPGQAGLAAIGRF
jgi:hypothetical protein